MSKFNSESERDDFKELCMEVLPPILSIEKTLANRGVTTTASISIGEDGYMSFDVCKSKWRMVRYKKGGPIKMMYEHSEEIRVTDAERFDNVSENLVEIAMVFADMMKENESLGQIDSATWKQKFINWANEFETGWDDTKDYPEEIVKFARTKIAEYAEQEEK